MMYHKKRMHAESSHVELIKTWLLISGRRQPFLSAEIPRGSRGRRKECA